MKTKIFFLLLSLLLFTTDLAAIDISGQITNQVSRTVSSGIAKNLFDNLIIPQLKVRNASGKIQQIQLTADNKFLTLVLADGSARIWDLSVGVQRPNLQINQLQKIAVDSQQQLAFIANDKTLEVYDILTAQRNQVLPMTLSQVKNLHLTENAASLLIAEENALILWDLKTNKSRWQQTDLAGSLTNTVINQQYVAVFMQQADTNSVEIRELNSGKIVQTLPLDKQKIIFAQFISADTLEIAYANGKVVARTLFAKVQAVSQQKQAFVAMAKVHDVSAFVLEDGTVSIHDQSDKEIAHLAQDKTRLETVFLFADGQKALTSSDGGQVFLWDIQEPSKPLLQLISTREGWTVLDNKGRFDSSEQAMPNVSWQAGEQEIPFENISKGYYEPGLLASALSNKEYLIAQPQVIQEGVTLPPKLDLVVRSVKKTGAEAELTVDVYDQGGGIENIDLFHNEKSVNTKRSIVSEQKILEQDREHRTMILKVRPTAGKNTLQVTASNKMGIESKSAPTSFEVNLPTNTPLLRIATIGINTYSDAKLNLDYSIADAQSIEQLLSQKGLSKYKLLPAKQLYNQNATKLSVLSVLRELSLGAQQDVLAIYFAGHGISVNGEWYFLPYETKMQPDLAYFASVGISATELSDIFKDSTIQHILLMVDACYSGASLDSFRKLQNSQRQFSRNLSRSAGITIVTATRKDQEAAELSELGHGLFTYVLGQGIRGDADALPKNKQISAHELANFSAKAIPSFSRKYLDAAQEPASFTMGADFELFTTR